MYAFINIHHQRRILNTETSAFVDWNPDCNSSDGKDRNGRTWVFASPERDVVHCLEANRDRVLAWDPVGNRPTTDYGRTFENYANGGCVVPAPYKPVKPAVTPDDNARARRRSAGTERRPE
jgi:hypothetical protein